MIEGVPGADPRQLVVGRLRPTVRAAVLAAAALLIALTFIGVRSAVLAHRAASEARIAADIHSKALVLAEYLRRELLIADQTLYILELEWQRDREGFQFDTWRRRLLALTDSSLQIFLTDARGIIRDSSRDEIIGDDVSGRDYFRHEARLPADEGKMFIGSLTRGLVTGLWQINLVRRLDRPDGSFAGVIAASYATGALARMQRDNDLGRRGVLAIISTQDGSIRAWGDPSQAGSITSVAGTPLFGAMARLVDGSWVGPAPFDHVDRIYGFSSIPGRAMQVVVGMDQAEAMGEAARWERNASIFAGFVSGLILLMAWLLLWVGRAAGQRHAQAVRDRAVLAEANTQLKAAEARERVKAAQLEATLTGMSDGIMMVDADLRLLSWNPLFPDFTGVPPDILRVGIPMESILRAQAEAGEFGPVDVDAEVARRMALLRAGRSMGTMERHRPGERILEMRRNPIPGGGFVTLYSDITTRRRAEDRAQRAQTMAAIGRLTAGVAHDFNNLLASILGNAEMLHSDLDTQPTQVRRVSIILQAADRGAVLVRQLLAFARKQPLAPKQIDLNSVVEGISELLRVTLGPAIRVRTQLSSGLWPALVDPVQVEHVLLNLAINARDAMPGGGELAIATGNLARDAREPVDDLPPGDYVVITVGDTGTGMTEEVRRTAFEPFFTTKAPGQGSGLGLSQVYGMAKQSGGGARIASKLGEGTTVRVLFPRALAKEAQSISPQALSLWEKVG